MRDALKAVLLIVACWVLLYEGERRGHPAFFAVERGVEQCAVWLENRGVPGTYALRAPSPSTQRAAD